MNCPSCGRPVGEHDLFCTQCGASLLQARRLLEEDPFAPPRSEEKPYLREEARGSFRDPEVPYYKYTGDSGKPRPAQRRGKSSLSPDAFSSIPQEPEKPKGSIASMLLMITAFLMIALLTFVLRRRGGRQ